MKNSPSPEQRLFTVLYDYGNLDHLCRAYNDIATLFNSADNLAPDNTAMLLHYLNDRLERCVAELKAIDAANRSGQAQG